MLIPDATWEQIRDQFTADEKATLRSVITGHVICPPAIAIDVTKLDAGLAAKITELTNPGSRSEERESKPQSH